jgi:hypothetical protein
MHGTLAKIERRLEPARISIRAPGLDAVSLGRHPLPEGGCRYTGKPSPWWFDGDHFFEVLRSAEACSVRELSATLDGCTGSKAGQIDVLVVPSVPAR